MGFLKKIMIVDDQPEMRDLLREYLVTLFGNRIVIRDFESVNSAKNFALNMDLIICDCEMNNGSGLDLYNFLNSQTSPYLPQMIIFTGTRENLLSSASPFYLGQVDKTEIDNLISKIKSALNL